MKGIIIYQGKYGATEQYAQWLAAILRLPLLKAESATPLILASYDLIILGSSVYVGKLVIRNWLEQHGNLLKQKKIFLFIVCGTTSGDTAGQQALIDNNLDPAIKRSTDVFFLPGRLIVSRLSWKDRLILKMGAMLEKDHKKKAAMSHDFDGVDRRQLDKLILSIGRAGIV